MIKLFKSNVVNNSVRYFRIPRIAAAHYSSTNNSNGNAKQNESESTTHFGFETVKTDEKQGKGTHILMNAWRYRHFIAVAF